MSVVTRNVYRQLLNVLRSAEAQGIPLTGCVALPDFTHVLCPSHYISTHFRHSQDLDDAFQALRVLPKQLAVLQACEEESRQALQQWSSLQQHWCKHSPLTTLQHLHAAESAAWLLQRLVTQQAAQQMLCEGDIEEVQRQSEDAIRAAHEQLDRLAASAVATDPQAFGGGGPASAEQRLHQLDALTQVLFKQAKLRNAPFEWVYDGLAPALLPQVLERGKGMPLSLALAAAAVARRLGMHMQLVCAPEGLQASTASGPLLMQQLPPEVAARQAGRTTASAPSPDNWLLQLLPPPGHMWSQQQSVYLDVSQNGKLLSAAACASRYPQLAGLLQQQHQPQHQHHQAPTADSVSQIGWLPPEAEEPPVPQAPPVLQPPGVVTVWASLARSMVTAHQRRGESDLVAHWLYQLLALDTQAPEWGHVLQ